jgi:hypothetical protein
MDGGWTRGNNYDLLEQSTWWCKTPLKSTTVKRLGNVKATEKVPRKTEPKVPSKTTMEQQK